MTLPISDHSCLLICNLHIPTNSLFGSMLIELKTKKHLKINLKTKIEMAGLSVFIQFLYSGFEWSPLCSIGL
jgi:hypothetical protein